MDSDMEDYGLEYSDESDGSEPNVQLENQYYTAKGLKADGDIPGALKAFQKVLELETQKGEWGFKALKQMIKTTFNMMDYQNMLKHYRNLLSYLKTAVTKNYAEKSLNHILDYVSTANQTGLLQQFYEITLDAMIDTGNDRLWFKTMLKLGKLFFDIKEFDRLKILLDDLHKSCQDGKGGVDQAKGTHLLEIYALEIQMYTEEKNDGALKELYEKSIHVKSAIPHPLIMGTIRECGGKMHLRNGAFDKANTDFFEAFKNYDESGSVRRIVCLKYLVLSNMLMRSDINPFDSQETKPFRNEPGILAMTKLVAAYQNNDVKLVEQILQENEDAIAADPFIEEHIGEILSNVRSEVLLRLVKPYVCIKLSYLAEELRIDSEEVIRLLAALIRTKCKQLRIDHINGTVVRIGRGQDPMDGKMADAMKNVCKQLEVLQKNLITICR